MNQIQLIYNKDIPVDASIVIPINNPIMIAISAININLVIFLRRNLFKEQF